MEIDGIDYVHLSRSPYALRQTLFFLFGQEVHLKWAGPLEVEIEGVLSHVDVQLPESGEEPKADSIGISLALEAVDFEPGMKVSLDIPLAPNSITIYASKAMGIWVSANSGDLKIIPLKRTDSFPNLVAG